MITDLEVTSSDGVFKYVDDTTTHEVVKKGENSQAQTLLDEINDWSTASKFQLHPQRRCINRSIYLKHRRISYNS